MIPSITYKPLEFEVDSQEYKFEIDLLNNTEKSFCNWFITITTKDTILEAENFTISSVDDEEKILTPIALYSTLKPSEEMCIKVKCVGTDYVGEVNFKTLNYKKVPIIDLDFTKFDDIREIYGLIYEYPKEDKKGWKATLPNPEYFKIVKEEGLLSSGFIHTMARCIDDIDYVLSWTSMIIEYKEEPIVVVGDFMIPINLNDIDNTYDWSLEFKLAEEGYISLYKNGKLFKEIYGDFRCDNKAPLKIGSTSQILYKSMKLSIL